MNLIAFFLPLIIMFGIFYFLIIIPQKKEKKRLSDIIENLKEGDKISTFSGIIGNVESIKEDTVIIKTSTSKIEILKIAIRGLE